jgi:hypothetical protein
MSELYMRLQLHLVYVEPVFNFTNKHLIQLAQTEESKLFTDDFIIRTK